MRNLTPDTNIKTQTQYATEPIIIIQIDWLSGTEFYSDKDILVDGRTCYGLLTTFSPVNATGKQDKVGEVSSVNVELHDSGLLKSKVNTLIMEGTIATVYHYYVGTTWADTTILLRGRISGPITWDEGARLLSFSIESIISDTEIGFSIEEGQLPGANKDAVGKIWPICFGTVLKLPALRLFYSPKATNNDRIYGGTPFYDGQPFVIDGGENFPQNEIMTLNVANTLFIGYFSGNTFYRSQTNLLWFTDVPVTDRDQTDEDVGDYTVCWITGNYNLSGKYCWTGYEHNYCTKQEGNKCYFLWKWRTQITTGTVFREVRGCTHVTWFSDPTYFNYWYIHENQFVMQWNTGYNNLYVANLVPSLQILGVYAKRTFNNVTSLAPVPSSYYTIHNPLTLLGHNVTAIEFSIPLESREGENWDSTVYVSLRSTLGTNVADIIKWLTDEYTTYITDASFDVARPKVNPYPANFALLERGNYLSIIENIAWQARCAVYVRNGIVSIKYLSEVPAPVYSITSIDTLLKTLKLSFTDTNDILTKLTAKWHQDYSGDTEHELIYRNNIDRYGTKTADYTFDIYIHEELVKMSLNFWGYRYSNSWRNIALTALLRVLKLEPYDAVIFDLVKLSTNTITGLLEQVAHNSDIHEIEIEAILASKAGDAVAGQPVEDPNFWTGDPSYPVQARPLNDPGDGITQVNYPVQVTDKNKNTGSDPSEPLTQTYKYTIEYTYNNILNADYVERDKNVSVTIKLLNDRDTVVTSLSPDVVLSLHSDDADDRLQNSDIDYQITLTNGVWTGNIVISNGAGQDIGWLTVNDYLDRSNYSSAQSEYFRIIDEKTEILTWTTSPPATITRGQLFTVALAGTGGVGTSEDIDILFNKTDTNDVIYNNDGTPLTKITLVDGNYSGTWYITNGDGSEVDNTCTARDNYNNKYTDAGSGQFDIGGFSVIEIIQSLSVTQQLDVNLNTLVLEKISGRIADGEVFQLQVHLHNAEGGLVNYSCQVEITAKDANGEIMMWLQPQAAPILILDMVSGEMPATNCELNIEPYTVSPLTFTARISYNGLIMTDELIETFEKTQSVTSTITMSQVLSLNATYVRLMNQLLVIEQHLTHEHIVDNIYYQYVNQTLGITQELKQIVTFTKGIVQDLQLSQQVAYNVGDVFTQSLQQDFSLSQQVYQIVERVVNLIQTFTPSQVLDAQRVILTSFEVTPSVISTVKCSGATFSITVRALDQYGNLLPSFDGSVNLGLRISYNHDSTPAETLSVASVTLTNGTGTVSNVYITGGADTSDCDATVRASYSSIEGYGDIFVARKTFVLTRISSEYFYGYDSRFEPGDPSIADDWNEVQNNFRAQCLADNITTVDGGNINATNYMFNDRWSYVWMNGSMKRAFGIFELGDALRKGITGTYINISKSQSGIPDVQNIDFYLRFVNYAPANGNSILASGTLIPLGNTRQSFDPSNLGTIGVSRPIATIASDTVLNYNAGVGGRCTRSGSASASTIEIERCATEILDIVQIKDYTLDYFNATPGCAGSSNPAWNGCFYSQDGLNYYRQISHNSDWRGSASNYFGNKSINGNWLTNTMTAHRLYYNSGVWTMVISCSTGFTDNLVWSGTKSGNTPIGTYSRTGGSSAKSYVELVSYAPISPATISINGYTDSFFSTCAWCSNSAASAWDGIFRAISKTLYYRQLDYSGITYSTEKSINGKKLAIKTANHRLEFDAGIWTMTIKCSDGTDEYDLWTGQNMSSDPIGIYDYIMGCASEVIALQTV